LPVNKKDCLMTVFFIILIFSRVVSSHPHFRGWKLSVILLACITKILVLSSTLDKGWHPFGVILFNLLQFL
jgi:hypothetical protein